MPHSYPPGREQLIRVLTDALLQLPDAEIRGVVVAYDFLLSLPPKRRALPIKILKPELSDAKIADMVGVDRSTLHRSEEYQRLKASLTALVEPMRGTVGSDGNIEAWE